MDNFNIILFLCNWGPHAAFLTLQDKGSKIPPEIKMVRIPCTGRISKSLLLKAFEMGADGVALVGCRTGTCRYGSGTETARKNTQDTRDILELLGIGKDRMRLTTFLPDESDSLLQFLDDFRKEIWLLGHSPVTPTRRAEIAAPEVANKDAMTEIVSSHDIYACQDCGKCTSACPLALTGKPFSPRALASSIIAGDIDSPAVQKDIWSCLTCGLCYDRCPSAVNFAEFVRDLRHFFKKRRVNAYEAHGGFFQTLMRTMTSPGLKTRSWKRLPKNIKVDPKSKILFFGGCAPYFDIFFREFLGVETNRILIDSLHLLNFFDIQPALLPDERCCGHDLLWSGDKENFLKLAELNAKAIHDLGIKEVVTACPECYRTLAYDYGACGIKLNFKVTHIYELLENEIDKGAVYFKKIDKILTYQDSCRLNRSEELRDLPRKLINRLQSTDFRELQDKGSLAVCCGNSAWTGCDSFSKALQVKRLKYVHETGSNLLVTSCPKCQIHLKCAMEDPFLGNELKVEMKDLTEVISGTISWE